MNHPRIRLALKWSGWCYVGYHVLLGVVFLVGFFLDTRPGSWLELSALSELFLVLLLYPVLLPAFAGCGGLHDRCESVLGHSAQTTVFVLTAVWAATGIHTLIRSSRGPKGK